MNPICEAALSLRRRHFFGRAVTGIGAAALASLIDPRLIIAGGIAAHAAAITLILSPNEMIAKQERDELIGFAYNATA